MSRIGCCFGSNKGIIPAKKDIIPVIASKPDQYSGNATLRVITDHVSI